MQEEQQVFDEVTPRKWVKHLENHRHDGQEDDQGDGNVVDNGVDEIIIASRLVSFANLFDTLVGEARLKPLG